MEEIHVTAAGSSDDEDAAPTSALASLRNRVKQTREQRVLERTIPLIGDGPEIVVKFVPIAYAQLEQSRRHRQKQAKQRKTEDDLTLLISCDILDASCRGIYARVDGSDELEMLDFDGAGTAARFNSPGLARDLGIDAELYKDAGLSTRVIRELYPADGDIIGLADDIMEFSGFLGEEQVPPLS